LPFELVEDLVGREGPAVRRNRSVVVHDRTASEHVNKQLITIIKWRRRNRKWTCARRVSRVRMVSADTQCLLGSAVMPFKVVIGNRPVDPDARQVAEPEV
jgi:hypothetical protein